MRLTPASRRELTILKEFLDNKFEPTIFEKITSRFQIYKSVNSKISYTLLDKNINKLIEIVSSFNTCYSAGCPFLDTNDDEIFFNVASIPVLAQLTDHRVEIKDKAIELFLYGRDIFKKSIIRFEKPIEKNNYAIIVDNKNRAYGIGELLHHYNEIPKLQDNIVVIKNILDIGFYLRNENTYFKKEET